VGRPRRSGADHACSACCATSCSSVPAARDGGQRHQEQRQDCLPLQPHGPRQPGASHGQDDLAACGPCLRVPHASLVSQAFGRANGGLPQGGLCLPRGSICSRLSNASAQKGIDDEDEDGSIAGQLHLHLSGRGPGQLWGRSGKYFGVQLPCRTKGVGSGSHG
jgi:hypothetical protein